MGRGIWIVSCCFGFCLGLGWGWGTEKEMEGVWGHVYGGFLRCDGQVYRFADLTVRATGIAQTTLEESDEEEDE